MKIQDLIFFLVFLVMAGTKNDRLTAMAGLICLFLAMPLFASWIFFTAQRLVIYAAAFFVLAIIWQISQIGQIGKEKKEE